MLTLGQAARLARTSKSTITRAIKTGRLSATRRDSMAVTRSIRPSWRASMNSPSRPQTVPTTGAVVHHATPLCAPRDTLDVRLAAAEGELPGRGRLSSSSRPS